MTAYAPTRGRERPSALPPPAPEPATVGYTLPAAGLEPAPFLPITEALFPIELCRLVSYFRQGTRFKRAPPLFRVGVSPGRSWVKGRFGALSGECVGYILGEKKFRRPFFRVGGRVAHKPPSNPPGCIPLISPTKPQPRPSASPAAHRLPHRRTCQTPVPEPRSHGTSARTETCYLCRRSKSDRRTPPAPSSEALQPPHAIYLDRHGAAGLHLLDVLIASILRLLQKKNGIAINVL